MLADYINNHNVDGTTFIIDEMGFDINTGITPNHFIVSFWC